MPLFSLGRKADQTIHLAPGNYQYLRGLERIVMKAIGADRRRQTMTRHLENQLMATIFLALQSFVMFATR